MAFYPRGRTKANHRKQGFQPQTHTDDAGINGLSERIIGCAFRVINTFGAGFLEKVYENASVHELPKAGLTVAQQQGITVSYDALSLENLQPACWSSGPSSSN
jgi:hypothetical protein